MIRQIRRQIQDLCAELTESAVRIIDAIEIPDHLIDSPLAKSDGQVYKNFAEMLESMPGTYEQKKWPLIYLLHRISHFN